MEAIEICVPGREEEGGCLFSTYQVQHEVLRALLEIRDQLKIISKHFEKKDPFEGAI